MVPRSNSPHHISAYTSFTGRTPSYDKHLPHAFGTAGFLQRSVGPSYNSAQPRGEYTIWLGTTRNLAGTHLCFNVNTSQMMTGDTFWPAELTASAITFISKLSGPPPTEFVTLPEEPLLDDPNAPYPLDPDRGVKDDTPPEVPSHQDPLPPKYQDLSPSPTQGVPTLAEPPVDTDTSSQSVSFGNEELPPTDTHGYPTRDIMLQVSSLVYEQRQSILDDAKTSVRVYAVMNIKEASEKYGNDPVQQAGRKELQNCLDKQVWEGVLPDARHPTTIPSKLFLTPKHTPEGTFKLLKGRIVGGGHRQDTSVFKDSEISSPTVSLTSVMIAAAMAANEGTHVMTRDHTAAYLNAEMKGPPVYMLLNVEVSDMLCELAPDYKRFKRNDGKITVHLRKALYGCVQSAVLWYEELRGTLRDLGFLENPYDVCSFARKRGTSVDRILVYVDDLLILSDSAIVLQGLDLSL